MCESAHRCMTETPTVLNTAALSAVCVSAHVCECVVEGGYRRGDKQMGKLLPKGTCHSSKSPARPAIVFTHRECVCVCESVDRFV